MDKKIKILIVDDQRLIRDALKTLLEFESGFKVIAEASNGKEAIEFFKREIPDVVLMDLKMPVMDGVEATKEIIKNYENVKVIILTTFDDDEYVFEGIKAGASGYLLKDISLDELAKSIRTVASGGALIEPSVAKKILREFQKSEIISKEYSEKLFKELTEREKEILKLLAKGLTNHEIASKLFLSTGTVKNYVTNILQKMGVKDRTQAALKAKDIGLL